jgi:type II secretory pathway predicted ATPase ExeA
MTKQKTPDKPGLDSLPKTDFPTAPFGKCFLENDVFSYSQFLELSQVISLAVNERSMLLVSGQAGVGKTTAVRASITQLPTNKYNIVYVGQDQEGVNLSRRLAAALGIPPQRSKAHTWLLISQHLSDNLAEQGKEIILIVDEAHLLDNSTLEDIRLLTNADFDRTSPLTVIMIAQLSLRSRLKITGFEALSQRLRFRYALEGLSEEETAGYMKHRLEAGGVDTELFTADAIKLIFLASQGIPREINNCCTAAIMKAQASNVSVIDSKLIRQILDQREIN